MRKGKKLVDRHLIKTMMDNGYDIALKKGARSGEVEICRTEAHKSALKKTSSMEERLLVVNARILEDSLSGVGRSSAMELLMSIGVLLQQNWGPTEREAVRDLNEYMTRRQGRVNMRGDNVQS